MPWEIRKQDNQYCVYKEGTDEVSGCHDTEGEAEAQLQALWASESKVKYENIDFTPTDAMVTAAKRALEWRREFGRGGTEVGIARARDISNRSNLSPSTAKRMFSFFSRHEGNKKAEGFNSGEDGFPSNGRIAWDLWGGDAGFSWSRQRVKQMDAQDNTKMENSISKEEIAKKLHDGYIAIATEMDDESKSLDEILEEFLEEVSGWLKPSSDMDDEDDDMEDSMAKSDRLTNDRAIKMLGQNRVGAYAVLWGDQKTRDVDGEYFTKRTNELTAIYDSVGKLPFLYEHGADSKMATSIIGIVDLLESDDMGLWYEAQLNRSKAYQDRVAQVRKLIDAGVLGTSSGTLPLTGNRNKSTGEITRWPIAEISATPTPADPRQIEVPIANIKSAFEHIGAEMPKLDVNDSEDKGAEDARSDNREQIAKARMGQIELIKVEHDNLGD